MSAIEAIRVLGRAEMSVFYLILANSVRKIPNILSDALPRPALAQLDVENHYRLRAIRGRPRAGLARLDKLDRTLGRRSVRKKATG